MDQPLHILFALAGLHRTRRGAEVVLETVAERIARGGRHQVTVIGAGAPLPGRAYNFSHVGAIPRERFEHWPRLPFLRDEFMAEELTFAFNLRRHPALPHADVTVTCGFPYTSLALRRAGTRARRARHVFVTQNGDWPAQGGRWEPRLFRCDGLICTNPVYYERNRQRWPSRLIPNGIDVERFSPGPSERARFQLPEDRPVILMVSALQPDKRVLEAIESVSAVPDCFLMIAGDGALRDEVDRRGAELLPRRYRRGSFSHDEMPSLFRSADALLHTSTSEPFGNIYIEALGCGTPVIAHDGENTRWILRDHGIYVDMQDTAAVARAVQQATATRGSRPAEAVAAWAHQRYSWDKVAGEYLDFIEQVGSTGRTA